jgi:hypothetical protein
MPQINVLVMGSIALIAIPIETAANVADFITEAV